MNSTEEALLDIELFPLIFCTLIKNVSMSVSFNIASAASYIYNLSGQKLIKDAKNDLESFFENLKLVVKQCYQTGLF